MKSRCVRTAWAIAATARNAMAAVSGSSSSLPGAIGTPSAGGSCPAARSFVSIITILLAPVSTALATGCSGFLRASSWAGCSGFPKTMFSITAPTRPCCAGPRPELGRRSWHVARATSSRAAPLVGDASTAPGGSSGSSIDSSSAVQSSWFVYRAISASMSTSDSYSGYASRGARPARSGMKAAPRIPCVSATRIASTPTPSRSPMKP
mmetsp:Transcript_24255/g.68105  ORF Transcript_24255/g.68105 Transcript_24255/m.68105 type:complete len:208 (+) Transcript_24255:100-723(+)